MTTIDLKHFVLYKVTNLDVEDNIILTLETKEKPIIYELSSLESLVDALRKCLETRTLKGKKSNITASNLKYLLPFYKLEKITRKQEFQIFQQIMK